MSDRVPWCDFGPEINNALNRITNYARQNNLTHCDIVRMFNAGIAARSAFAATDDEACPTPEPDHSNDPLDA